MARPHRRSTRHLGEEIELEGQRFRFFQAVRLLALSSGDEQSKAPIPASLRFSSPLSLGFQASEIASIAVRRSKASEARNTKEWTGNESGPPESPTDEPTQGGASDPIELSVAFMGLTGPSGALPTPYTELFIDRRHQFRDRTGHAFLDMFTHRAVSLFYQAWRKHRFYLPYEAGNPDGFSRNLLDIVGVGLRHLQQRLAAHGKGIPDRFLIHYAGLLTQKPIPTANIAALVRGFFAVDACVEPFVGQWMPLPPSEQSALDGRPCLLGQNTFVGERLWDRQNKIRLRLGPLSHGQFVDFLPGQPGLLALRELVQFCVGLTLDCDVTLILKRGEIPAPVLGAEPEAPRLGHSLWLNSKPAKEDAGDASFALLAMTLRATSAA